MKARSGVLLKGRVRARGHGRGGPRTASLATVVALVCASCVTVHSPLQTDPSYPQEWGELSALGPECKSVDGDYRNVGVVADEGGRTAALRLMSVFNLPGEANTVSLRVRTRKVDQNGDAFITLRVVPDGNVAAAQELTGCFCIKQTLACTQLSESYWAVPNFGVGGSQKNAYFSISRERSLIARLQNYRIDVILSLPMFRMKEPWARFEPADD